MIYKTLHRNKTRKIRCELMYSGKVPTWDLIGQWFWCSIAVLHNTRIAKIVVVMYWFQLAKTNIQIYIWQRNLVQRSSVNSMDSGFVTCKFSETLLKKLWIGEKRNSNIKNIFIMVQKDINIMANQVKSPI